MLPDVRWLQRSCLSAGSVAADLPHGSGADSRHAKQECPHRVEERPATSNLDSTKTSIRLLKNESVVRACPASTSVRGVVLRS